MYKYVLKGILQYGIGTIMLIVGSGFMIWSNVKGQEWPMYWMIGLSINIIGFLCISWDYVIIIIDKVIQAQIKKKELKIELIKQTNKQCKNKEHKDELRQR